jgi:DNA-binding MarR family transcriptional regulator
VSDPPSQQITAVWISLIQAGNRALAHIETALADQNLPPLGWYDALLEIERAEDKGLRPFVLQNRLLLAQYSMSRLLKRLETAGLIRKIPCASDGRGHAVQITDQGAAVRRRMWPVYARALNEIWQDRFTKAELARMQGLLDRVAPPDPGASPKP